MVSQDQSTAKFKKQKTFSSMESLGKDKELISIKDVVKQKSKERRKTSFLALPGLKGKPFSGAGILSQFSSQSSGDEDDDSPS